MSESIDDLLETLGLGDTKPATREDEFYFKMLEGNNQRLHMIRYWLMHEMSKFQWMIGAMNIKITKSIYSTNEDKVIDRQFNSMDYAKVSLRYYLQANHLPWFQPLENKPACGYDKVIDLLIAHDNIKEVIEKDYKVA